MSEKRKLFISFRFNDGYNIKEELAKKLGNYIVNKSEDEDRSTMTDETIKKYLYEKLRDTSITICLLTPNAINYHKDYLDNFDDWLYDELRYSLEDREGNRSNGIIAVYTEDTKNRLIEKSEHICEVCKKKSNSTTVLSFENLIRKNMFNVKSDYKKSECPEIYNSLYDHYISLISYDDFISNPKKYINNCIYKRDRIEQFNLKKKM